MFVTFHHGRFQLRTRPPPTTALSADVYGDAPTAPAAHTLRR